MKRNIQFTFHILFHPADGFWDMKREKRGSLSFCLLLLALHFVTMVIEEHATGFIFDVSLGERAGIIFLFLLAIVPIFLLALANLSITTFLEGEGTFRDIFMMGCYTLTPVILARVLTTVLSNVMSLNESMYISGITVLAALWTLLLFFVGIMEVHNYGVSRTIASALLTVIAMVLILFLLLLFLDMVSRIFGFGYSIVREIGTRI